MPPKPKVGLARGGGRYDNIRRALDLIAPEIHLEGVRRILIKVNLASVTVPLASTQAEAVRALLDFLRPRFAGPIAIAEGTGFPAHIAYRSFGYREMAKQYGLKLLDLNDGPWGKVEVRDRDLNPMTLRFSRPVAEADFVVSLCPPKTHDCVLVTLSLKNLIMGSLYYQVPSGPQGAFRDLMRQAYYYIPAFVKYTPIMERVKGGVVQGVSDNDRQRMHQGFPTQNLNLYLVARRFRPHLSVIDGYWGMEGDGPGAGHAVSWDVAIASVDPVAADCLASELMGFPVAQVGYLSYCVRGGLGAGRLEDMEIRGADPEACRHLFRPHPTHQHQRAWADSRIDAFLALEAREERLPRLVSAAGP
ncbi:MAG: DUF362 domain-containing protein [Chloroflexi bacterium]|nr:DUF362 domain-containing protein [Chloroflexota bacterium]